MLGSMMPRSELLQNQAAVTRLAFLIAFLTIKAVQFQYL